MECTAAYKDIVRYTIFIMAKTNITHRDIVEQVRRQEFVPVYLLMGEESYYIDRVCDFIAANALKEEERDFNETVVYCTKETDVADIAMAARRFPMMAKYQLVIVKEAQNLLNIEALESYVSSPSSTTILVICYKNGLLKNKRKLLAAIEKVGVVFESNRLKDGMLPQFITDYLRRKTVGIEPDACQMLAESVGTDLNRMASELDKLVLALKPGQNRIDANMVKEGIGVSKEFNVWELRTAVCNHDVALSNKILFRMELNPKLNSPIACVAALFNLFAGVMQAYYAPDRSERGLMTHLELKTTWQLRDYTTAMRHYSAMKTMQIIGKLREADARLKGVGKGNMTDEDVMHELLYFILH